jgi:MFS family permease
MVHRRLLHFFKTPDIRSAGILFLINALIFSNYAVRLPDIKEKLMIDDGQLGLALLLSPLGVVVFTPVIMVFMNKYGTGKLSVITVLGACLSILVLAIPDTYPGFCLALFCYGLFHGGLDVSMNGVVSAIEKKDKKVYMSTAHGFWSLGAMLGAFMGSGIAAFEIHYTTHFCITFAVCLLLLLFCYRHIWPVVDENEGQLHITWPGKNLALLIFIVFIGFLVEGAIVEWNAIFYNDILGAPAHWVGLGFAGFTASMAISRFFGDGFLDKYDNHKILLGAFLLSISGLLLYAQAINIWICFIAMIIAGMGCSIIVPLVFFEAGRVSRVPPSVALSMISTFGYSGLLVGPPLMGFISDSYRLTTSFMVLIGFYCLAIIASRFLDRRKSLVG